MVSKILTAFVLYITTAYTHPTDLLAAYPSSHVGKRSPCDGKDGEPILYHDYKDDVCRPPMKFESPGQCEMKQERNDGANPFRGYHCGGLCETNVSVSHRVLPLYRLTDAVLNNR